MYRILITQPNMPKDTWKFYKVTVNSIDPDTNEVVKTSNIYEAETLAELSEKYVELLNTYTAESLYPIDVLKVELNAAIEDETDA